MLLLSIVKVGTGTSTQYHAINSQWAQDSIYDYQWNFITNVGTGGLGLITSVILVNDYFWVTRWVGDFWRFSTTWSNQIMATGIPSGSNYQWVAYYPTTNQFYVTNIGSGYNRVDVFTYGLAYLSNIAVSGGVGQGISFYNDLMYIPNTSGQINIIDPSNSNTVNTVTISECSGTLGQITFDSIGNYAVACYSNSKVVLYSSTNVYLNTLITDSQPQVAIVDDVGRFVVATYGAVDIFETLSNSSVTMPTTTVKLATSNIQGKSLIKNHDFQLMIFEYLIF